MEEPVIGLKFSICTEPLKKCLQSLQTGGGTGL
jgi:hypothetical protein